MKRYVKLEILNKNINCKIYYDKDEKQPWVEFNGQFEKIKEFGFSNKFENLTGIVNYQQGGLFNLAMFFDSFIYNGDCKCEGYIDFNYDIVTGQDNEFIKINSEYKERPLIPNYERSFYTVKEENNKIKLYAEIYKAGQIYLGANKAWSMGHSSKINNTNYKGSFEILYDKEKIKAADVRKIKILDIQNMRYIYQIL